MDKLNIHIIINRRYQVYDHSGRLPFSIIFGLCRRSREDTEPRPLVLNTARTVLDVPYALANGLLSINGRDTESERGFSVDMNAMGQAQHSEAGTSSTVTLSSPVGRTSNWRQCMTVYEYDILPGSELATLLTPGNSYEIRIRNRIDFGGHGHNFTPATSQDEPRVACAGCNGRANFAVVDSLPWPPPIQTRLRRAQGHDAAIDITVINTGTEPVSVQTQGRQRYLSRWGPMQPHEEYASRPRLIDMHMPMPAGHLVVLDVDSGRTVREVTGPPVCELYGKHDPRPRIGWLLTLRPGEPLVRRVDVSGMLSRLPPGRYRLRMEARGMWWAPGCCEEWESEDENRVPRHMWRTLIPPAMLKCNDIVEVRRH